MVLTIDRLEAGFAVCEKEDGGFLKIPLSDLPEGCGEGTVLVVENSGYRIDRELEEARRREAVKLQAELFGE